MPYPESSLKASLKIRFPLSNSHLERVVLILREVSISWRMPCLAPQCYILYFSGPGRPRSVLIYTVRVMCSYPSYGHNGFRLPFRRRRDNWTTFYRATSVPIRIIFSLKPREPTTNIVTVKKWCLWNHQKLGTILRGIGTKRRMFSLPPVMAACPMMGSGRAGPSSSKTPARIRKTFELLTFERIFKGHETDKWPWKKI